MKNKKLHEEYNKLERDIHKLKDVEINLSKELRRKGEELQEMRKAENSKPDNFKEVLPKIKLMFRALEEGDYDSKLICNHFGVSATSSIFCLNMSARGNNTQIVIEVIDKWVAHEEVGLPKEAWDELKRLIEKEYSIIEHWNGNEWNTSTTIVLMEPCPQSLKTALQNYDDKPFSRDNFEVVFQKNLEDLK